MLDFLKFRRVLLFSIPSFVYWLFCIPKILVMYIWYKYKHKDFNNYMDVLRTVNELRKVCKAHGDRDKNYNWNIKCYYYFNGNALKVKVRFNKKAGENVYDKFKLDIENYSFSTTEYEFEYGYGYFYIVFNFKALMRIKVNRHSLSVGTYYGGLYMWNFVQCPHALIVGDTGQGKSTLLYYMLNGLCKNNYCMYMIDGKTIDFNDCKNIFYKYIAFNNKKSNYNEILDFIEDYKNAMYDRLEIMKNMGIKNYMKSKDLLPVFLIFDEYLVMTDQLDKKQKERLKTEIGTLVRTGRACGYIIIVTMQRADSEFISTSIRDNFKLKIVVGEASDTSYQMMFESQDFKGFDVGRGWVKQGHKTDVLQIPFYEQVEVPKD